MGYKLNPFTGELDYYEAASGATAGGTDELVKTTSADSTAGYLGDKIDADTMAVDTASQTVKVKDGVFASAGHTHSWSDVSKSGSKLSDLEDVPAYQADKVLGVDSSGTTLQWVTNSGGGSTAAATTYLELDDTPSSYSGQAGKVPVVKGDESGLDWFDAASAGHTHTASEITDFDNEVSNNTDVAANTSARHSHSNKTLLDSLISSGSGTEFLADDGSYKAVSTVDEKVKADSGDSSAGYLSDKVDGTTIEVNTSSHTIQVVDGIYASVGHTHDDRYYTETETDNLLGAKADKVSGATNGNFAGLDSNGNLTDSGKNASDFAAASHTHTASDISDFDTEVSNNTDVAANTSARHSHSNKSLLDSLISSGSGTNFLADDGTYKAGTSGSDEKVAVDSSSTPDYLGNLIAGSLEISSGKLQLDNDSSSPGAWKVYGTNGSGTRGWYDMETPRYTKLIAYNSSGRPEYVGEADPGTATSASSWRIKKLTYDTDGNITAVKWADGNSNFDNVWDNRTSYSYS